MGSWCLPKVKPEKCKEDKFKFLMVNFKKYGWDEAFCHVKHVGVGALGPKIRYQQFLRPRVGRMRRPGMQMERPFRRLERPRQRGGRYGSKMERPGGRRPEYKEGWRNMNTLPPLREGCGHDCEDCADEPICHRAGWGPCRCTDKQGKVIMWRLPQSEESDARERSMRMMNKMKRPRRMRRNKAGMRMMDKPMRQRRRNKARMTMRKKMKSLESSESKENSS